VNVKQFHHHVYPVFEHNVLSLKHCPSVSYQVRLAALLHDVGKPKVFKLINGVGTFYNHEYVGAKMADKILRRLKFSNEDIEKIVNLVRNHMFYYNVENIMRILINNRSIWQSLHSLFRPSLQQKKYSIARQDRL